MTYIEHQFGSRRLHDVS